MYNHCQDMVCLGIDIFINIWIARGLHLVPLSYSRVERSALSYPKGLWNVGATTMPRSHCHLYFFFVPSHMYSFAALMNTMQNKRHTFPRTIVKIIQITL